MRRTIFAVARQVRYSTGNENSLDLALFLNGLPIFTVELKNPLTGQTVEDAIRQYRTQRDPLFAHFAVDPDLVYVTTHLTSPRRAEDPLSALQPRQVRRRWQPTRPTDPRRLRHRLPLGGNLGA